jgi:hypothetical protein
MKASRFGILAFALVSFGCGSNAPLTPTSTSSALQAAKGATSPMGSPGYEPAYYNNSTVWINAIEVPQHAPAQAKADLYEVVYPIGWENMGLQPPQCNPCDHTGDGIDFTDYHDHILDSMPSSPGNGEYKPLWHVWVVIPAYNHDPNHDSAVGAAYAAHIPTRSEADVDALTSATMADGSPLAVKIDTNFYFICAVVNQQAATH